MKRFIKWRAALGLALGFTASAFAGALTLNGAGSTFINPLLSKWGYDYNQANGMQINYQSIGSGGGIQQLIAKTVDFGATDAPMSPELMQKAGGSHHPLARHHGSRGDRIQRAGRRQRFEDER